MKRILLIVLLAVSMVFTAACGNEKNETVDTATEEEGQDEAQEPEDTSAETLEDEAPETEKTEWGSDEFGYITLSSDWHKFITSDVSAEQNANMLQWQSSDLKKIVTLSSGNNSPEDIILGIASSEEPDTYAVDLYGEEDEDYQLGYFGKWYEDEDLWLLIYSLKTDYSDKTYYYSFEGTGYENEDDFLMEAHETFFTHSEFKKTSLYRGMFETDLSDTDSDSGSIANSGAIDTSNYKVGDKYPIYDFITDDLIIEVTIPEGFTLDPEYCTKDIMLLDKDGTYASIWIDGYTDLDVEDYLKEGHLDDAIYGSYSNVSAEMIEEYSLSNGFKVYVLEIKYRDEEYDLDIHRYNISVQKSEDVGVSISLFDDELEELGFKSVRELLDVLFVE